MYNKPINSIILPNLNNLELNEKDELFVDIQEYSKNTISVNMQYKKQNLCSAINTAYVRKSVAEKLMKAKELLPKGYTFEILDAWRPYGVQLELYKKYYNEVVQKLPKGLSEDEIRKYVTEFVSFPDKSKLISYAHSSGGAVDLTLIDEKGNNLNMGSAFDEFSDKSYTSWYEKKNINKEIRNNRRLLYNVLTSCGFTNYPSEWWHYDFGDVFWSFYSGEKVMYTSKFEISELNF